MRPTDIQSQPEDQGTNESDSGTTADQEPVNTRAPETHVGQIPESESHSRAETTAPEPQGEEINESQDTAPYGYRADGVTPRNKPGRPPKDAAAAQERDRQRARLKSVTPTTHRPREKFAQTVHTPALAVVNYQAMGESVASMWFAGGELIMGSDWAPDTKEGEHTAVAGAFRDYFKAQNMRDLPPGVALCFVLGIYTLKRATKPTVKRRFADIGAWFRSKMPKRGLRLATQREASGA